MKRKIAKLNKDVFERRNSYISFNTTSIFFSVDANDTYTGGFQIESKDYKSVRGMIYTSTFRMKAKITSFDDKKIYIPFTFNANGLMPGEKIKGKFTIITDVGEYEIDFCASVNIVTIDNKYGTFSNLEEFRELAFSSYDSAFKCFTSPKFREIIPQDKEDIINLYDGLSRLEIDRHAMEEFLICLNLKNSVQITLLNEDKRYEYVESSFSDSIDIIKNDWGYLSIDVQCESSFVEIPVTSFSTFDFNDNTYKFEYTVDETKLSKGNNFAIINFITPYETKTLTIKVYKEDSSNQDKINLTKQLHRDRLEVVKSYIDFKCNNITSDELYNNTIPRLEHMFEISNHELIYKLIEAHLYVEIGEPYKGEAILNDFHDEIFTSDKSDVYFPYNCYISSLIKNDISFSVRAADEIKKAYNHRDSSWELLWINLQMESIFVQNNDMKFNILEQNWNNNVFHSVLMLEAYMVLREQPSLLEHINPFMLHILTFAKRRNIITEDVARYVAIISTRIREFNPRILEILEACYDVLPSKDVLTAICRYLIIGQKTDNRYFKWFAKGVEENIHISNLYEYYMYSLDKESSDILPNRVYLYFSNPTNLDFKTKSFIYSDIVKRAATFPEIYERAKPQMSKFAREQLLSGRISKHLKILYERFLPLDELNNNEYKALADLYYTYEISTEYDNLSQVIVLHKGLVSPNVSPVVDGKAVVKLYTKDDQILLQDKTGKVFIKTIPYKVEKCIGDEHIREIIKLKCSNHIGFLLSSCYMMVVNDDNAMLYKNLLDYDGIQDYFKREIRKSLLWYFYEIENHVGIGQFISHIKVSELNQYEKGLYFGILLSENRLKGAYDTIKEYGYEGIDTEILLEFCDQYLNANGIEEDSIINELCYHLFDLDIYSDNILEYLEVKYCGTTKSMIKIWDNIHDNSKKSFDIEERILIQMLFCDNVTDEEEIFYNYYINKPKQQIVKAYLSYKAFSYFAYNYEIEDRFFEYVFNEFENENKINSSCQLATLKYYAGKENVKPNIQNMLNQFLIDCANKNLVFDFFSCYSSELLNNLSLSNRYIVSYQGTDKSKLTIYYCITRENEPVDEFVKEIIPQHYFTYFIKEFILFKGEVLHYYLVEDKGDISQVVEAMTVSQKEFASKGTGRFLAINNMLNDDNKEKKLEEYEKKNYIVNQIFQIQ